MFWTDICMSATSAKSTGKQEPTLGAVLNHAHLIRNLTLRYASAEDHFDEGWRVVFSNLTHLSIERRGPDGSILLPSLASFIQNNKATLVNFTMDHQFVDDNALEALCECPRLKECRLAHRLLIDDPDRWTSQFERLWSRLEVVSLREPMTGSKYIPLKTCPTDWSAPRDSTGQPLGNQILDLTLSNYNNYVYEAQLWILLRCTNLKKLSWYIKGKEIMTPMQQLAKIIQQGHSCQQLEELRMGYMNFENTDFASLLSSISQLNLLDLRYSSFDGESWECLLDESKHLRTLAVLDLTACHGLPGWVVQEILCEMPNLKVLRAPEMEDMNILRHDLPWVCQELEELELTFILRKEVYGKDLILTRLSELTKLQVLLVDFFRSKPMTDLRNFWTEDGEDHLSLSVHEVEGGAEVGGGLDHLRTLRRLRVVSESMVLYRRQEEAEWIVKNWPRLEGPVKDGVTQVLMR
ncbi:hypothetical protein EMPS_00760 [Entomortierella parvispora]|uniref:F-box domain-containing protein n=1 Tax=Entomortierella parvispora TaxID=205924 RepID=A0A9P3H1L5_9FUNG|nr:hypothetical protein EMPS_00760 [Entomortierella parvispora]